MQRTRTNKKGSTCPLKKGGRGNKKEKQPIEFSIKKTELFPSSFKKWILNKQSYSESQFLYLSQNKEKNQKL